MARSDDEVATPQRALADVASDCAAGRATPPSAADSRFAAPYRDAEESAVLLWQLTGERFKAFLNQPIPSDADDRVWAVLDT